MDYLQEKEKNYDISSHRNWYRHRFLFYELVGLSPGGIVTPGYIALFINQPGELSTIAMQY